MVEDYAPTPVYPSIRFKVSHVEHVFVQQDKVGPLQPAVNASYGPLSVDAPITPDLLLSGFKIQPVILTRQVRSSSPVVKILFHMSSQGDVSVAEGVRSEGMSSAGARSFCVAQLKPEPMWFSSSSRSGSSSREAGRSEGVRGLPGNQAEVYFQSRSEQTGQCSPQDSLQRLWVGRTRAPQGSGTPMRRMAVSPYSGLHQETPPTCVCGWEELWSSRPRPNH
ncbi:hypothetical protein WMY93_021253 [Mugilogobius chulae]|uniref:Uncharacterized protein n=1 Tax=Mugilogobius chulae TaxID=88201 RepID=A0AAW0NA78_9GOBI